MVIEVRMVVTCRVVPSGRYQLGMGMREPEWELEMFGVLILVVVTRGYMYVKVHRSVCSRFVHFTVHM